MFRKTFIRLVLVMMVALTTLLVFAFTRPVPADNEQCCDNGKDCGKPRLRTEWMILETISRSMMSLSAY